MSFCICAVHQLEGFSWDYDASNMEFFWNSTQTASVLKSFREHVMCQISAQKQSEVFCKKVFLEISQNWQKNTCARILVLISCRLRRATLLKKWLWPGCFPVNFAKFLKAPFRTEHFQWLFLSSIRSFTQGNMEPCGTPCSIICLTCFYF